MDERKKYENLMTSRARKVDEVIKITTGESQSTKLLIERIRA